MIVYLIFPCYLCQNLFIHSGNLTTYKQSYSVENPLTCSICLNSLTHHGNFTAHKHSHSGKNPFSCYLCKK